jgi:hypothetical protein
MQPTKIKKEVANPNEEVYGYSWIINYAVILKNKIENNDNL